LPVIEKSVNGISFFEFPNLSGIPGLRHGVFTRRGGYSQGPYQSLNVGLSGDDDPENVIKNRQAIEQVMANGETVFIHQVHGTRVVVFPQMERGANDAGLGVAEEGDAVISNIPGMSLAVQTADCQAILLYDPVRRAVGNIHSGWRGSIQNIIAHTVARMMAVFGTRASDLLAGIGPSLGPCCAEFIHYRREIPESLWHYGVGNNHFDFWAMSRDQLQLAGVPAENIAASNFCTRCRTDLFFSYRREKITGRFAAVIGLEG
jgi:YfiH family protein